MGITALVTDPHNVITYVDLFKEMVPWFVPPVKFGVAFPLIYHYANGFRHMVSSSRDGVRTNYELVASPACSRRVPILCMMLVASDTCLGNSS